MGPSPREALQFFIYRAQVTSLYRKYIREIRGLPSQSRADLRAEIRSNFESHKGASDLQAIKFLLSDGRQRLKQLQDMLGLQR